MKHSSSYQISSFLLSLTHIHISSFLSLLKSKYLQILFPRHVFLHHLPPTSPFTIFLHHLHQSSPSPSSSTISFNPLPSSSSTMFLQHLPPPSSFIFSHLHLPPPHHLLSSTSTLPLQKTQNDGHHLVQRSNLDLQSSLSSPCSS